jgi:hypothetical protein
MKLIAVADELPGGSERGPLRIMHVDPEFSTYTLGAQDRDMKEEQQQTEWKGS